MAIYILLFMCYDVLTSQFNRPFMYSPQERKVIPMPRRSIPRPAAPVCRIVDLTTGKTVEKPSLPIVCDRIRFWREKAGLEQKALAKSVGVTANAVSNWENGRGRPDLNLVPDLCAALGISLYDLFGLQGPSDTLTAKEQQLIGRIRQLSPAHYAVTEQLVDGLIAAQEAADTRPVRQLICYARSLAAGRGDPTEFEEEGTPILVYDTRETQRADCVFHVSGDSMEPVYHSGDQVLVSHVPEASDLRPGEVGAFICGNETYIKVFEEDGLHSLNPAYKTMHFDQADSVYLIGRVTGILSPDQIVPEADAEKYGKQ